MRLQDIQRTLVAVAMLAVFAAGVVPAGADKPDKDNHRNRGNEARQEQQQAKRDARQRANAERQTRKRAAQAQKRKQELIGAQRARARAYDRRLVQQTRLLEQRRQSLRAARRQAQYEYQQQYIAQLNRQRAIVGRGYDYDNDPYYTTAPSWRYVRGGRNYEVNQYAADVLRRSVNNGYEQGVRAGQADRQDGWSQTRYQDSWAYQDATYGFEGAYVDIDEYQYYFRQGFQRGYQDGLGSRSRYGTNDGGKVSLLATVLNAILNLQSLR